MDNVVVITLIYVVGFVFTFIAKNETGQTFDSSLLEAFVWPVFFFAGLVFYIYQFLLWVFWFMTVHPFDKDA